jgi:hypothetical protein
LSVSGTRTGIDMLRRTSEAAVTDFLRAALTADAVGVPKLDAMAREAGLLGAGQRIGTLLAYSRGLTLANRFSFFNRLQGSSFIQTQRNK